MDSVWRDRFYNEGETNKILREKLDKERDRAEAAEAKWQAALVSLEVITEQSNRFLARTETAEDKLRLLTERVARVAEYYAQSSGSWVTLLITIGKEQPFAFPGDKEIKDLLDSVEAAENRAEAAKVYVEKANIERDAAITRTEAAQAEVARLRNENESLRDQLDEALAQIESMWRTIAP